ncbi:hypothetical protein [Luteimonas sp. R10]|uniref:hypothetical protein n=1 Tax=Luteimonas sp. R10 TaxID=3108176 RepID=UPI00308E336B|nr:hypothetical protein U3649_14445 [Luteimonas sp. R10]
MADHFKAIDTGEGIDGGELVDTTRGRVGVWMQEQRHLNTRGSSFLALGLSKFGALLAQSVLARVIDLEARIASLEQRSVPMALDAEIYDTVADMAKRLDEVEDHAWKHRGYWREGARAQRNEVYAHNGSSWICNRATRETPCVESADWTRLARAGRDGRDA